MATIESRIDTQSDEFLANHASYQQRLTRLREEQESAMIGGRDGHIERHRKRKKYLPRERIDMLIDTNTAFLELSTLAAWGQYDGAVPCAGIVTGIGMVENTPCMIIANDATVKAGSFFPETIKKHLRAQEIAEQNKMPCIYLVDCGGGYLPMMDKFFPDRDGFGNTFLRQCRMSYMGLPQVSAVFGGCTAGGAYIPALSDEMVMVKNNARIHLGGPSIVKIAVNEDVDGETLGGAEMHSTVSGVSDHFVEDEEGALATAREIIAKSNFQRPSMCAPNTALPPRYDSVELLGIVSRDRKYPYDVREVIARLIDDSDFQEFKPLYAAEIVAGTGFIHGFPIGIIGNNGPIASASSLKAAHFVELCNQRNIPLLFLHNVSGFMVGKEAEQNGIAKDSAKLVYAQSIARVPRITVLIGGSYGAGNYGMCGRGFWPDFLFAWPTAEVAGMSPEICSNIMMELRKNAMGKEPPTQLELDTIEGETRRLFEMHNDPFYATSRLWDDGLIEPGDTRNVLGLCLALCNSRPKLDDPYAVYRM
ncbi:methylcrotonoyl-CoA carboxylase [Gammaproteobacteria bacterium 45_16_T64]|nr:methylcrotonoyl-CoA carboxylase [Gammaproteobacteria bacterium 45_16_T64]